MDDVHRLWHHALESYFDPDEFRVALQNCISNSRTVTWLLQNHKRVIPDFEVWYGRWRATMAADPVMRWLVDARNQIEKRGDLEARSSVRANVIASYLDNLPIVEVKANVFDTLKMILEKVPHDMIEKQILEHGLLQIERRWVANNLPDHELLDALGHAYGRLSLLVDDAHRQLGLPLTTTVIVHGQEMRPAPGGGPRDGRLPCMIAPRESASLLISLKTGLPIRYTRTTKDLTAEELVEAGERYGMKELLTAPHDRNSLRALARLYFSIARKMFLKDGYHVSVIFLVQGNKPVQIIDARFEERGDKYVVMRRIAQEIERCNADAVMIVGEIWRAIADPENPFLYPSEIPGRTEHLSLWACSEAGELFSLTAEITRRGDRAELGDILETENEHVPMFEPIREVWRKRAQRKS